MRPPFVLAITPLAWLSFMSGPADADVWAITAWMRSPQTNHIRDVIGGQGEEIDYEGFLWRVGYHRPLEEGSAGLQVGYSRRSLVRRQLSHVVVSDPSPPDMYSLFLRYDMEGRWNESTLWNLAITPVYENASENTSRRKDWKLGASAVIWRRLTVAQIGLGLTRDERLGRQRLLPLLAARMESENRGVRALLPAEVVAWSTVGKLRVTALARWQGGRFRTDDDDIATDEWVEYRALHMAFGLRLALPRGISVGVFSGLEALRHFDGENAAGQGFDRELEQAPVVSLHLGFGAPVRHRWPAIWGWE